MEGLYQTPPVMYPVNNYHSTSPSHRPNDTYDYRRHSYGANFHDSALPGTQHQMQNWGPAPPELWNNSPSPPPSSSVPPPFGYPFYSMNDTLPPPPILPRPRITTNVWEDEGTLCYQVDAKGICVARRQDNDMINGTKLLNVVGMSRGKRDGILKNEKGRVVVKVGAMHLKGVWITFFRAKELSTKFKVLDLLYPLFEDDPSIHITSFNSKDITPSRYMEYFRKNAPQSPTVSPTMASFHPKMDLNSTLNHGTANKHIYPEPNDGYYRHVSETETYLVNGPSRHSRHNYNHSHSFSHTNRSSFSSMSSHHSHMYALQHETDDTSKDSSATTPNSYMETPHSFFVPVTNDEHGSFISNKLPDIITAINNDHTDPFTTASPGTPSSWFSPEPLYHHQQQQSLENENTHEKVRRSSSSSSLHSQSSQQKLSTAASGKFRKPGSKKLKGGSSKI